MIAGESNIGPEQTLRIFGAGRGSQKEAMRVQHIQEAAEQIQW